MSTRWAGLLVYVYVCEVALVHDLRILHGAFVCMLECRYPVYQAGFYDQTIETNFGDVVKNA